jgi:DNA polymerase III subunit beta
LTGALVDCFCVGGLLALNLENKMKISQFKKLLPVLRALEKPSKSLPAVKTISVAGRGADGIVIEGADHNHTITVRAVTVAASTFDARCVDFAKFNKVIGAVGAKDSLGFSFGADDGISVEFGKRRIDLASAQLQRMDYPAIGTPGESWGIQFETDRLLSGLAYCGMAVSDDETRFHLNGIHFEPGRLCATDGHRLHIYKGAGIGKESGKSFILSATTIKLVQAAIKACGGDKAMAHLTRTEKAGRWVIDGGGISVEIVCRFVDSSFPPVDAVIPKEWASRCFADAAELASAAKLLGSLSDTSARGVELRLNGALSLYDDGVTEIVSCKDIEGDEIKERAGANPKYIVDACALPGATVRLSLGGGLDPWVFEQDDDFLAVVMPVRI